MPDYLPPNPKNKKKPYSCPKCKADIRLRTEFFGFDVEDIDPETGEWIEDSDVYTERNNIHNVEWRCSKCVWMETTKEEDEEDD